MKRFFLFLSFCFISIFSFSQQQLIPYRSKTLWGFCDTAGTIKIKPQYQTVREDPYSGLLIVTKSNKQNIIDFNGKILISSFDTCGIYGEFESWNDPIRDDIFVWIKNNGKFGLKATTGKEIIPVIYDELYYRYENIKESVYARKGDSIYLIPINNKNKKTYYSTLEKGENFRNSVLSDNDNAPPAFDQVLSSTVYYTNKEQTSNKVTDSVKARHQLDSIEAIPDLAYDMTCYIYKNNKVGLWNSQFMIEPIYDSILDINLYRGIFIATKNGKTGIVKTDGTLKAPFIYSNIEFINRYNTFITESNNKKGFIVFQEDRAFEFPPAVPNIERFSELNFNGYNFLIFKATDNGRLLGFIGQNGIQYFKD